MDQYWGVGKVRDEVGDNRKGTLLGTQLKEELTCEYCRMGVCC